MAKLKRRTSKTRRTNKKSRVSRKKMNVAKKSKKKKSGKSQLRLKIGGTKTKSKKKSKTKSKKEKSGKVESELDRMEKLESKRNKKIEKIRKKQSEKKKRNPYLDPELLHPGPVSRSFYPAHFDAYSREQALEEERSNALAQASLIAPGDPGSGSWVPGRRPNIDADLASPWGL